MSSAHRQDRNAGMLRWFQSQSIWMIVNLIGIVVFLILASKSWLEPELGNVLGASAGDALVWFVMAVPVLVLFLISNLVWLAVSLKDAASSNLKSLGFGALLLACWVAAFLFDNAHHSS
jgi:ABC-type amino acid transport system permease subunit